MIGASVVWPDKDEQKPQTIESRIDKEILMRSGPEFLFGPTLLCFALSG